MSVKYSLRRFLMFKAFIARVTDPTSTVNEYLVEHPELASSTEESWEGWNQRELPGFPGTTK